MQLATESFRSGAISEERQEFVGLAYFADGHKLNMKGVYGRARVSGARPSNLFQLTFQSFEF